MIDHAKALEYAQQVKDSEWFKERITTLAQAYLDLHQRMQWQPIESAPHNEPVRVWSAEEGILDAYFATDLTWRPCIYSSVRLYPTHWMPLPLPPTQEKAS